MIHGQMQQQAQTAEIGSVVRKPVRARRINWVSEMASWAFVAPYLIAFVLFLGYPICFGFYISLHHWSSIVGDEGFAGIGQYAQLFNLGTLAAQDF
jgi:multiple sugar transport system permease protein